MKLTETSLAGCLLIDYQRHCDERGYFVELYVQQRYQQIGLHSALVQDNLSHSKRGTIRGMHFQRTKPQGKLITVLNGKIYDVMVDIRPDSGTFGNWQGIYLHAETSQQLWIPPGFAHGFQALADNTLVHYKTSSYYDPDDESSFNAFDPQLAIAWPESNATRSVKDQTAPAFTDIQAQFSRIV